MQNYLLKNQMLELRGGKYIFYKILELFYVLTLLLFFVSSANGKDMYDKIILNSNMTNEDIQQLFKEKAIDQPISSLNELLGNEFYVSYLKENKAKIYFNFKIQRGLVPFLDRVIVFVQCENGIIKNIIDINRILIGP